MKHRVEVAIIGSGFAGSILAWVLAKKGMSVALIDGATHPRFAIGESSTPIADTILRRLGESFDLGDLMSLSAWGSWQRTHSTLSCGRKRGFSYFVHGAGQPYQESQLGENSLLVAASASDDVADTHWYRPEVDAFFWRQAISAGAIDLTAHQVMSMEGQGDPSFQVHCRGANSEQVDCEWIIDASGQSGVLAKLASKPNLVEQLDTRSHSTFAHFRDVASWSKIAATRGCDAGGDPFDPDDAAQHHLLEHGWLWMLRFNNGITSIGYTAKLDHPLTSLNEIADRYPSIAEMMKDAKFVAPKGGATRSGRLQRWFDPVVDSRRIMLPTAAVTLDPLHSTGIAHALAGVERVSRIITCDRDSYRREQLQHYRSSFMEETRLLDRLVSTAYETIGDFQRFTVACMLYFAGAIRCEERYQRGETPTHLWNADDAEFVSFVDRSCSRLRRSDKDHEDGEYIESIRQELEPWNTAGLMNPNAGNRYAYTATKT